jgi:hypothetical protein
MHTDPVLARRPRKRGGFAKPSSRRRTLKPFPGDATLRRARLAIECDTIRCLWSMGSLRSLMRCAVVEQSLLGGGFWPNGSQSGNYLIHELTINWMGGCVSVFPSPLSIWPSAADIRREGVPFPSRSIFHVLFTVVRQPYYLF